MEVPTAPSYVNLISKNQRYLPQYAPDGWPDQPDNSTTIFIISQRMTELDSVAHRINILVEV